MKWFERLFKKPQDATLKAPTEWLRDALTLPSATGKNVTENSAMRVSAVYACVRVLSETVASLPLFVYERRSDGGKDVAVKHPLYNLLHSLPNQDMTSFDLRELMMANLALRGNAYHQVVRAGGRVQEIIPLNPTRMIVERTDSGFLNYVYQDDSGSQSTFKPNQIWRIPGLGFNGLVGMSPIALARESIGLALATEEHGARLFSNGAQVPTVLEHPGSLSDAAYERLKETFSDKFVGVSKAHQTAILEEGMKLIKVGMTSEDSQFIESRKYQVTDIARIFRIPPHLIGDLEKATFGNIEHQSIEFVVHTIRPWLVRIEQSINRDLFTQGERGRFFAEFNVDGLLRGDIKSRYEAYGLGIRDGHLSRNEVRGFENKNRVDGLDEFLIPMNMAAATGQTQKKLASSRSESLQDRAISRVVRKETSEIRKAYKNMDSNSFDAWLPEFYSKFKKFVSDELAVDDDFSSKYVLAGQSETVHSDDVGALMDEWLSNRPTLINQILSGIEQ